MIGSESRLHTRREEQRCGKAGEPSARSSWGRWRCSRPDGPSPERTRRHHPKAPEILQATRYGNRTMTLRWDAPWSGASPILKFQVRHARGETPTGEWTDVTGGGSARSSNFPEPGELELLHLPGPGGQCGGRRRGTEHHENDAECPLAGTAPEGDGRQRTRRPGVGATGRRGRRRRDSPALRVPAKGRPRKLERVEIPRRAVAEGAGRDRTRQRHPPQHPDAGGEPGPRRPREPIRVEHAGAAVPAERAPRPLRGGRRTAPRPRSPSRTATCSKPTRCST